MIDVTKEFNLLMPEILCVSWAFILLLIAFFKGKNQITIMILSTMIVLGVSFGVLLSFKETVPTQIFFGMLEISTLHQWIKGFFLLSAFLVVGVLGASFSRLDIKKTEVLSVILLAIVGGSLLISANHFLVLFVALELMGFSTYIVIASWEDGDHAIEASLKYFITGGVASAFLLLGIVFLYSKCGDLDFDSVERMLRGDVPLACVGAAFVLGGLLFKLPVAPFHMWAPDVYQGSSSPKQKQQQDAHSPSFLKHYAQQSLFIDRHTLLGRTS